MKPLNLLKSFLLYIVLIALSFAEESSKETDENFYVMPDFVVTSKDDKGYYSANTLAGTRTNELTKNIPMVISTINAQQAEDFGVDSLADLGNMVASIESEGDLYSNSQIRFRGFLSRSQLYEFMPRYSPLDYYNVERSDVIRGANSLVYGQADPGGKINVLSKRADFSRNRKGLRLEVGSQDYQKINFDINQLIGDNTAVRYLGTHNHREFDAAFKYQKFKGSTLELAHNIRPSGETRFRLHLEKGRADRSLIGNTFKVAQGPSGLPNGIVADPKLADLISDEFLDYIVDYSNGDLGWQDVNGNPKLLHELTTNYTDSNNDGKFTDPEIYWDLNGDGVYTSNILEFENNNENTDSYFREPFINIDDDGERKLVIDESLLSQISDESTGTSSFVIDPNKLSNISELVGNQEIINELSTINIPILADTPNTVNTYQWYSGDEFVDINGNGVFDDADISIGRRQANPRIYGTGNNAPSRGGILVPNYFREGTAREDLRNLFSGINNRNSGTGFGPDSFAFRDFTYVIAELEHMFSDNLQFKISFGNEGVNSISQNAGWSANSLKFSTGYGNTVKFPSYTKIAEYEDTGRYNPYRGVYDDLITANQGDDIVSYLNENGFDSLKTALSTSIYNNWWLVRGGLGNGGTLNNFPLLDGDGDGLTANVNGNYAFGDEFYDLNDNGTYDIGEPFQENAIRATISGNEREAHLYELSDYFAHTFFNPENLAGGSANFVNEGTYIDSNNNGRWDLDEDIDINGNGFYRDVLNETFIDASNGIYDLGEEYVDANLNGTWDDNFTDVLNGIWDEGEEFTDDNNNGVYDQGEAFVDALNGVWDEGEAYIDLNGNGIYDDYETFTDVGDGIYNIGEEFTDLNGDGRYNPFLYEDADRREYEIAKSAANIQAYFDGIPRGDEGATQGYLFSWTGGGPSSPPLSPSIYNTFNGELFTDEGNGVWDAGEEFTDSNGNGVWDDAILVTTADQEAAFLIDPFNVPELGDILVPAEAFTDAGNGLWDSNFTDATNGVWDANFTDENGNGIWDYGEPYIDVNDNDIYDDAESFIDSLNGRYDLGEVFTDFGNGTYDEGEAFVDELNGFWDPGEEFEDLNGNTTWDPGEPLTDTLNGVWDPGEAFTDSIGGNGVWDSNYTDENGNGQYDVGEAFNDQNADGVWTLLEDAEPFVDALNGSYDQGETFTDALNGRWDEGEAYNDLNGNGIYDDYESFIDYNGDGWYDFGREGGPTSTASREINALDRFVDVSLFRDNMSSYSDADVVNPTFTQEGSEILGDDSYVHAAEELVFNAIGDWMTTNNGGMLPMPGVDQYDLDIASENFGIINGVVDNKPANSIYDLGEPFVDKLNGAYDPNFIDFNGNGIRDSYGGTLEPFTDIGNGIYDNGESFTDIGNGTYDVGENFEDSNPNGQWDIGEVYLDDNNNGQWDIGEPYNDEGNGQWDPGETFTDIGNGIWDVGEQFVDEGNGVFNLKEEFVDLNDNGIWDNGEEFTDLGNGYYDLGEPFQDNNQNGMYDYGDTFTDQGNGIYDGNGQFQSDTFDDLNGNGIRDMAGGQMESFNDVNGNGVYDDTERFVDLNGNGKWDQGEAFEDILNGFHDNAYIDDAFDLQYTPNFDRFTDAGNGVWDDGESFTDVNANGQWDPGEQLFWDANLNGQWDPGDMYVDSNNDGQWDGPEPFNDTSGDGTYNAPEQYTDVNGNGIYDDAESFTDTNGNGFFDLGEDFVDTNGNGIRDLNFVDTGDGVYSNTVERFTDSNGNGRWDPANGIWDSGETFTDIGNGLYDNGEAYVDTNANGIWDEGEAFTDLGNGQWDEGEAFVDLPEEYVDVNQNGKYDTRDSEFHWDQSEQELQRRALAKAIIQILDLENPEMTNNEFWKNTEQVQDLFRFFAHAEDDVSWMWRNNIAPSLYLNLGVITEEDIRPAESFTDLGNGVYDIGESYEDANGNSTYDVGETFTDIGNSRYDEGEQFVDANNNGVYDEAEYNPAIQNTSYDFFVPFVERKWEKRITNDDNKSVRTTLNYETDGLWHNKAQGSTTFIFGLDLDHRIASQSRFEQFEEGYATFGTDEFLNRVILNRDQASDFIRFIEIIDDNNDEESKYLNARQEGYDYRLIANNLVANYKLPLTKSNQTEMAHIFQADTDVKTTGLWLAASSKFFQGRLNTLMGLRRDTVNVQSSYFDYKVAEIPRGYIDNGNGRWDDGEEFTDTNANGVWDEGEVFVDMPDGLPDNNPPVRKAALPNMAGETFNEPFITPSIGALYWLTKPAANNQIAVFANYSKSVISPTGFQYDVFGDLTPPETGKGIEFGFKFGSDLINGQLTTFRIDKKNEQRSNITWPQLQAAFPAFSEDDLDNNGFLDDRHPINRRLWEYEIIANNEGVPILTSAGELQYRTRFDPLGSRVADEMARSEGIELDLYYNPTSNISIVFGYAYLDTTILKSILDPLEGLTVPGTSDHNANFTLSYRFEEGFLKNFTTGFNQKYRSAALLNNYFADLDSDGDQDYKPILDYKGDVVQQVRYYPLRLEDQHMTDIFIRWGGKLIPGRNNTPYTSFQLNVSNIFGNANLISTGANNARYTEGRDVRFSVGFYF